MLPNVVDLEVTSKCNLKCPFCFGPQPNLYNGKELNLTDLTKIAKILSRWGVEKIVVTGGEPLIRPDIIQLLEIINDLGMKIILSTNGYLLAEKIKVIAHLLDWISLPLDGSSQSISQLMRCDSNHHLLTINNIRILEPYKIKIKIGTVVCKYNYQDLTNIAQLLSNQKIDTWKLYEFSPRDRGFKNQKKLAVDSIIFFNVSSNIVNLFTNLNIIISPNKKRDAAYFLILPDGQVVTPMNNSYKTLGHMLDSFPLVTKNWEQFINHNRLTQNFKTTYPSSDRHG